MAHHLKLQVLAEGVETSAQRDYLRRTNCDGMQGFLMASGANEAFELLASNRVDVVISDHRMPNMQGVDFLTHVRSMYPHTARIVLTAYQDEQVLSRAVNEGEVFRFLTKPWDDEKIRQAVKAGLAAS